MKILLSAIIIAITGGGSLLLWNLSKKKTDTASGTFAKVVLYIFRVLPALESFDVSY